MCRIDGAEQCLVWDETSPRARSPTQCTECRRPIEKGDPYRRVDYLFEGRWGTEKFCAHCTIAAEWLRAECGGYVAGGVREEIAEHAQEYRDQMLWRLVVGMNRKWKRFADSSLMPIPQMPDTSPVKP